MYKKILIAIAFTAILIGTAQAQVQQLVDFNSTSDLTTLFNPDATPVFTNISDQGIGNTGSINVPIPSNDIWTTKSGYSVSGEGDVYTLSAFFKIKDNNGYGGLGFSPNDTNEPDGFGSPVYGLGMCFHGGGGYFIKNRVNTSVSWPPDLVIGNWYKMIFKVTAKGSNLYDLNFQIWNSDADGVLGTMKTEKTLNNVSNTQVGGASTLHVYFSAAGSRMEKIDDFEINLEGGAVIIEEGAPVLTTDAVTSITANTATGGGNVTDDQGSSVTVRGVCWSTTTGPTTALSTKTSDGTGTGVFTSSLTGLAVNTTYYVRAYATNSAGTSYGSEVSFEAVLTSSLPAGSGTSGDPYQIATLENLLWITASDVEVPSPNQAARWAAYYIQTADIDASGATPAITPIGISAASPFSGNYDGKGFTISNLTINGGTTGFQGLFGYTSSATIQNLVLTDVNISGGSFVGGLAGYTSLSTITSCGVSGTVTGSASPVGGLMGGNLTSTISQCWASANAKGTQSVGGLIGQNGNGSNIQNCYATGVATATPFWAAGGFIGWLNGGTLNNCYATGKATAVSGYVGGFIGYRPSGTITNCFWNMTIGTNPGVGSGSTTGVTGLTSTEMQTNTTFLSAGWDYTIWNIGNGINNGYPYLDWQNPSGTPLTSIALPVGAGTEETPYQIATLQNLTWIAASDVDVPSPNQAARWAAYYIQTADIDASSTSTWNSGTGWSPIGNTAPYFTGTYNGNGHTINGLYINRAVSVMGLFGTATGGTITNLGVINVNITGGHNTAALVGSNGSTISNCYSTGTIIGYQYTGGLVGQGSNVSNCYSSCSVTGSATSGGLIGRGTGTIKNCYSTGNVTRKSGYGSTEIGGFMGSGAATIQYCFSTGSVIYTDATDPTDKGFLGNYTSGTLTGNFWDTETSLQTTTAGTATGKTTTEMKTNITFSGWDDTIWNIGDGINNGYPYLVWQNPGGSPLPVELSSFSAAAIGSNVKLSWNTATEVNNYGFEIERKVGSPQSTVGNYEKIGFVNGNGNSNSPKDYSFVDTKASTGKYSYRLKQIDNNGQFEYSKTIEADFNTIKNFELSQNYPNPFNPSTTIRFNLPEASIVKLTIFNILGQEIRTLVNEFRDSRVNTINFDASGLNSGIYIYKIEAGNFVKTRKMILLK